MFLNFQHIFLVFSIAKSLKISEQFFATFDKDYFDSVFEILVTLKHHNFLTIWSQKLRFKLASNKILYVVFFDTGWHTDPSIGSGTEGSRRHPHKVCVLFNLAVERLSVIGN